MLNTFFFWVSSTGSCLTGGVSFSVCSSTVEVSVGDCGLFSGTLDPCDDKLAILERLDDSGVPVLWLRTRKENGSRFGDFGVASSSDVVRPMLTILLNISILFCTEEFLETLLALVTFPLDIGDSTLDVESFLGNGPLLLFPCFGNSGKTGVGTWLLIP